MSTTKADDAVEAVETALRIHDGIADMVREGGIPRGAIDNEAAGFIAALQAIGFDVTPTNARPRAPQRRGLVDSLTLIMAIVAIIVGGIALAWPR